MNGIDIEVSDVGSFVSARIFPQLADTMEVAQYARTIDGLKVCIKLNFVRAATSLIQFCKQLLAEH